MPPGLKAWEAKQKHERDKLDATLAEKAQAEKTGITPEQRRAEITEAYERSDTAEAFRAALEQHGYVLAKGDKRGLVVVDKFGDVHSLTRYIKGHSASTIKKKLSGLEGGQLPGVDEAKEQARLRREAAQEQQREQRREEGREQKKEQQRLDELRRAAETKLLQNQETRRLALRQAQQELLTRHQGERLALHAAQETERKGFLFRVRSAVADLIGRTPGLRSVLSPIQKMTQFDPRERHRLEHEALLRRQERDKQEITRKERLNARVNTRERASFEAAMRKAERLVEARRLMRDGLAQRAQELKHTAAQEFYEVARDLGLWKKRTFRENELTETFNDEAEYVQRVDDRGDDDEGYEPERKFTDDSDNGDGDDDGPKHRPGRGRGYGYRRDSD